MAQLTQNMVIIAEPGTFGRLLLRALGGRFGLGLSEEHGLRLITSSQRPLFISQLLQIFELL